MVRIKGVNSDYEYSTEKGKILEHHAEELYMRIFICPNDQPSTIDQREKAQACCKGESTSCPGEKKSGHAAITLHQKNGILLQTDGAELRLEQGGSLVLKSSQGIIAEIKSSKNGWEFCSNEASLKIYENGNLELASAKGKTITLNGDVTIERDIKFKGNVTIEGDIQGKLLKTIETMVDNAVKQNKNR